VCSSDLKAQQVYGGHGYIEEWGMSQFTRDARIAMIYEGANGVQALDLVGRKLAQDGGKHVMAFFDLVKTFIKYNAGKDDAYDAAFLEPLKAASKDLQAAGMYFMQNGMKNPNNALSGSNDFMHMFGHVCLGLMWAQMGKAATEALANGASDAAFYATKLATGRFYMARQLPATALHLARIHTGADTVMRCIVQFRRGRVVRQGAPYPVTAALQPSVDPKHAAKTRPERNDRPQRGKTPTLPLPHSFYSYTADRQKSHVPPPRNHPAAHTYLTIDPLRLVWCAE